MENSLGFHVFGVTVTNEELWILVVVILGLAAFELGPKALNSIKNRRNRKPVQKN